MKDYQLRPITKSSKNVCDNDDKKETVIDLIIYDKPINKWLIVKKLNQKENLKK